MKNIIVLVSFFLLMFVTGSAHARSISVERPLSAFPSQYKTLPSNASIIVEVPDDAKFNKRKKLYFRSGKHKVRAKLVKTWKGPTNVDDRKVAYQFRAVKRLKVGRTYLIKIGGEKFSWEIGRVDKKKPKWKYKGLKFRGFSRTDFRLDLNISDFSPVFFEVVLKIEGEEEQRYFVDEDGLNRSFGGTYSGPSFVQPSSGKTAVVEITPYDYARNKGKTKKINLPRKE